MREEEIKLTCNSVEFEKETKDVGKENILAPGLLKNKEPSEKTAVRKTRHTKMDTYFAAMEDMWDE